MNTATDDRKDRRITAPEQSGSALVMAVFVLMLLAGMGAALLFLTENEMKMSNAGLRTMKAFYLAEAGIEDGRTALWDFNRNGPFSNDLDIVVGVDLAIDFDPTNIVATRDGNGNVTGFTGYNDDVPATVTAAATALGDDGMYIAFLTNDVLDGLTNRVDSNERVLITGIGAGDDGSFEIAQAIIELKNFIPSLPPATITLLGPDPAFDGSKSKVKVYEGEDCAGGAGSVPNLFMPVVGGIGAGAIADPCPPGGGSLLCGFTTNPTWDSGALADEQVFADLSNAADPAVVQSGTGRIDDDWRDCQFLHDMMTGLKVAADVICPHGTRIPTTCAVPASSPTRIIYAEGDVDVLAGVQEGTLAVAGELTVNGNTSWDGLVLVLGEGEYHVNGAGAGVMSGGIVVADIAGPDGVFGTADDCTGGDGGFSPGVYDERGGGNAGSVYCTVDLLSSTPAEPYNVVEFLQR